MTNPNNPTNKRVLTSGEGLGAALQSPGTAPYVDESNTFHRMLETERNKAERIVFDLDTDIARLQDEIRLRESRRDANQLIIARIEAALGVSSIISGTANEVTPDARSKAG